jgi:tetratricopeptide (TPR) repeat protein
MSRFCSLIVFLAGVGGSAALADGCPVAPNHDDALAPLFEALQTAQGDMEARQISNQMWALWTEAPDEPSQAMLDAGMKARGVFDFLGALEKLDSLVSYCPFYAEGYNQRAFVRYLQQDYDKALPDLNRALELNPNHIGALAGKALTQLALGQEVEGQRTLRQALALNPWLSERVLLKPLPGQEL